MNDREHYDNNFNDNDHKKHHSTSLSDLSVLFDLPRLFASASKVMRRGRSLGSHRVQIGPSQRVTTRTTFAYLVRENEVFRNGICQSVVFYTLFVT